MCYALILREGQRISGAFVTHVLAYGRVFLALFLLAAVAGCKEENKYEPPPASKVGVAQPVKRPVTRYLELTGNTVSLDKVELVARVKGFLQQINYTDGSMVKKGDVLFVIEPAPYEAKVLQEESEVTAAKAASDFAEAEFQRQHSLSQTTPFGWQAKFYEAQRNRDEKRAQLQKAQAALESAKIELGYTKVTAPFDGIVTTHLVAVGALVGSSSPTALATILRLDPIYVTANFSEQDVLRIIADPSGISTADLGKIPIELGLMTDTGYPHKGVIDYIAPQVDPSTGTLRLRGVFANPNYALLPGLFAHVRVPPSQGPEKEELLVPETAFGSDQAGRYVLVVDKDNIVDKRSVTVGPAVDDLRVVEKGLAPEDRVIVAGLMRAIPGQKVNPETVAGASTSKRADAAK
jgi:RND family efflux transporter MFP subunit